MPIIATAAWSIPKTVAARFASTGSGLQRYASVFSGVEVNSTFYRVHRPSTFEGWAAAVPEDFRFAVKISKEITHGLRLQGIDEPFRAFLDQIAPLGAKLGPLLCQLPPSLAFDADIVQAAFAAMRGGFSGEIALEVRHRSWACEPALTLMRDYGIVRVLADPAPVWPAEEIGEPLRYVRLHGTPRIYYSRYSEEDIAALLPRLAKDGWCIFDNTASGAAIENALSMIDLAAGPQSDCA